METEIYEIVCPLCVGELPDVSSEGMAMRSTPVSCPSCREPYTATIEGHQLTLRRASAPATATGPSAWVFKPGRLGSLKYSGALLNALATRHSLESIATLVHEFDSNPGQRIFTARPRFTLARPFAKPLTLDRPTLEFLRPHLLILMAGGTVRIGRVKGNP